MSSRVVPAEAGAKIQWKRLHETGTAAPESGARQDDLEDAGQLRQRLRSVEEECAAREQAAREEARRAGFHDGMHRGTLEARQQMEKELRHKLDQECAQVLGRVTEGVEQLVAFRLRIRQQMEEDLVRLAVAVARRIVHRELSVDPAALLGVVKAAVEKIDQRELHRLRVGTADLPVLESAIGALMLPARVELVGDPSLPRGSVLLDTARGQMDASIETQLDEIDRGFTDLMRRA